MVVAVIIALPTLTAVTRPFSSTFAMDESEDVQKTDLSVVFSGSTVASSCRVSVAFSVAVFLLSDIAPARVETTLTFKEAETPDLAVMLIVVEPSERAVILPSSSTEATSGLELSKVRDLSVAVSGSTVTMIVLVSPTNISRSSPEIPIASLSIMMPDASVSITVTSHSAFKPLVVVAVIIALPTLTAVTRPFSSTVATVESEEVQKTDLSVVVSGSTVASSCRVSVAFSVAVFLLSDIAPARVGTTLTFKEAETPDLAVMLIVVEPSKRAVTLPSSSTEATSGLELSKVTDLSVAVSGSTVTMIVLVSPTSISRSSPSIPIASLSIMMPDASVSITVTSHSAFKPFVVVAVIVALPTLTAVTRPFSSTFAIEGSEEVHVIVLSSEEVFSVAIREIVSPDWRVMYCSFKVIDSVNDSIG